MTISARQGSAHQGSAHHPDSSDRPGSTGGPDVLWRTVVDSPVGPLTVVASDAGVRAVLWPDDPAGRAGRPPGGDGVDDAEDRPSHPVLRAVTVQLGEYFAGQRRHFDVPLDPVGTEFQRAAWEALRTIPYATTISYAEQAERLGDRRKARAVGAANGRNPIPVIVPCHRVVAASGALTGFAGGLEAKSWLLDHERRQDAGSPRDGRRGDGPVPG